MARTRAVAGDPAADDARCLLVGRAMIVLAIVVAGWFGINPSGFVAEVVAFAFGLAAASFFLVILLGVFERRTNRAGVIAGMLVGIGFTGAHIAGNRFFGMPPWCFGIGAPGIGAVGLALKLATTLIVSRLTPPSPAAVRELVEAIRVPRGAAGER